MFHDRFKMSTEGIEDVDGDGGMKDDPVVTTASLIVNNKLLENITEDLAERLYTVQEFCELALDLDDEPNSFRFIIAAMYKICQHPLTEAFKEEE